MSVYDDEREDALLRRAGEGSEMKIHIKGPDSNGQIRRRATIWNSVGQRADSGVCRSSAEMISELEAQVKGARW